MAVVKALAGDTISGDFVIAKVPKDQLLVGSLDSNGEFTEKLISSYAVKGQLIYRVWPFNRIGDLRNNKK